MGEVLMETGFKYELKIKGRNAKIGDKVFAKKYGEYFNVRIEEIGFNNDGVYVMYYNIDTESNGILFDISKLSLEKPTTYQLPDTEGNLSEVKIGQGVWSKRHNENPVYCKIIRFDKGDIVIESQQRTKQVFNVHNISGLGLAVDVTTNKPKRDFSPYFDFNQSPNGYDFVGVDENGYAFWYEKKPKFGDFCFGSSGKIKTAGFRQNLINPETGKVDDWKDSLVERPKE